MKNTILIFALFFIAMLAYTDGVTDKGFLAVSDKTVLRYEKKVETILKNLKANPETYYKTYLKAGNTLNGYGYFHHALKYYQKALAVKRPGNKLPLYHKILKIYGLLENRKMSRQWTSRAMTYLQKHPQYQRGELYTAMLVKKAQFSRKPSSVVLNSEEIYQIRRSDDYVDLKMVDARKLFQEGQFEESLKILTSYDFSTAPLSQKVFYDLNRFLVDPKAKYRFLCQKDLSLYPSAPSYSLKICSFISKVRFGKTLPEKEVNLVKDWIQKNHPEEKYFITGIEQLQAGLSRPGIN